MGWVRNSKPELKTRNQKIPDPTRSGSSDPQHSLGGTLYTPFPSPPHREPTSYVLGVGPYTHPNSAPTVSYEK